MVTVFCFYYIKKKKKRRHRWVLHLVQKPTVLCISRLLLRFSPWSSLDVLYICPVPSEFLLVFTHVFHNLYLSRFYFIFS